MEGKVAKGDIRARGGWAEKAGVTSLAALVWGMLRSCPAAWSLARLDTATKTELSAKADNG